MGKENKTYRIRTNVNSDSVVNFTVDNTIDTLDILSLSIDQKNTYKLMGSNTGVIAGRVLANGGFGVPNVKVSVFIPYETTDDIDKQILYSFTSTKDIDNNGVRYNLLPNELDDECHQNIGTFPSKRVLLDNNNWIDVFDKYYQFTTRTNESGDYMIYGVPVGTQTVHMDVDLSDIGILSQKPRDLIYKGYNANMFENTTKFKVDTNIDSLAQVITQDQSVYVYPFWGDTTDTETNAAITRCDMNINYKFEPTCVFMGSVVTDAGENAMNKKCIGAKKQGLMSDMITGEGKIEMIRKTPNGQIEQFSVKGDNNINNDGIWCYQIPMNLDYVMTDEFGKMVMTDNPNAGIPTRARVRFRLSMSETPSDVTARKRARFLIPNNPHLMNEDYPNFTETKEIDYEFGTKTKDENFRDLMWNNVYTVKSYIPRLQKSRLPNNLRHLGIKMVNHSGSNNPIPFNNLRIKFNFIYMFLCTLVKVLVTFTRFVNAIITSIGWVFYALGSLFYNISKELNIEFLGEYWLEGAAKLFAKYKNKGIRDDDGTTVKTYAIAVYNDIKNNSNVCDGVSTFFFRLFFNIGCGIALKGLCETDDGIELSVTPGTNDRVKKKMKELGIEACNDNVAELYNCVENQLAQENEVTSFNFYNDWINGVVYLPLWYRRIKKRRNGEIKKDQWCSTDNTWVQDRKYKKNLRLYSTNTPKRVVSSPNGKTMGKINPLVNNENTVDFSQADDETGRETLVFNKINDDNCYGYQCHKYARSYFKVYKGLVFEKETMLGDKVYYYKPCDYDPSTGNSDLVTLFATDLVLLGSLNDCDMHGIPQFFKCLESTTYNMPPDLLSETYDYVNEDNQTSTDENDNSEIDLGSRMTEYTGADWGNLGADQSNYYNPDRSNPNANENEYDNGGLFYGITCFDSYTKPKSCINLSRICELGVSLDENIEIQSNENVASGTESDSDTLTPDGFVSYDEIYNPDYRSIFATLNGNFLRTKLNPETGLLEYDFNHMYLDNFDGSLKLLMKAKTVNGYTEKSEFQEKANYINNYNLENSSDAYLNFRYGDYTKQNNKKIYFYENNNVVGRTTKGFVAINGKDRQPRYENSFYFYFGLNEGKTAIDKFNNEFFSDCTNKFASDVPYTMTYQGNSWCPTYALDGFIAFDMNVDAPYTVKFTNKSYNNVYYQLDINQTKFIFCSSDNVPEGYEKYTVYNLNVNESGSNSNTTNTTDIIPTGRYRIEITDAYDNVYEDEITFELPRIGFVCDVAPFNCKNKELMTRFDVNSDLYQTYTAIANYGTVIEYTAYSVGDIISSNTTYYTYDPATSVYTSHYTYTPIVVPQANLYYYKHDATIDRDIYGFVALSEISENDFKIDFKPIDEDYFGNNYIGTSINVHINNGTVNVTENHPDPQSIPPDNCGYIGYGVVNDIVTFYFGVPYGNQRYKITVTQLCEDGESKNTTTINVIVYEDEFKMYINSIDYDLISSFKGGWNETQLLDGKFKDENGDYSEFDENNLIGWNTILNIGEYQYSGTKQLSEVSYFRGGTTDATPIGEVMAICNVLSSSYSGSGTPYSWTDNYCFNAPSLDGDYYIKGKIQETHYTYTIAEGVTLYDETGNIIQESDIVHNLTYYTDTDHTIEAVLDIDYYETSTQTILDAERYDVGIIDNYGAFYRIVNTNITCANEDNDGNIAYLVNTSNPNVEYSDLECMTFFDYRGFIDSINETINARGEMSRQVAGRFRINDGETILNITTKTKAKPVKYLIVGNQEMSLPDSLYNYKPNSQPGSFKKGVVPLKFSKMNDINNTKFTAISEISNIFDGYVVDRNFDTTSISFRLPTLTYGEYFNVYPDNDIVKNGDVYYMKEKINGVETGEYKEYQVILNDYRLDTPMTMGQYKQIKHITETVYKLIENGSQFAPYYTRDRFKHPYYVSVKNDNDSVIPPGDDISNFNDNGSDKDLITMFPVHFYNKPLKSEFLMLLAFINNTPAYPKYALADDRKVGWLYNNIVKNAYVKTQYDNNDNVSVDTVVYIKSVEVGSYVDFEKLYEYKVTDPNGMTIQSILDLYPNLPNKTAWNIILTEFNGANENITLYNGDVIYVKYKYIPEGTTTPIYYYKKHLVGGDGVYYDNYGVSVFEYIDGLAVFPGEEILGAYYLSGVSNPNPDPGIISRTNPLIQTIRYYVYDDTTRFSYGDKYYIRTITSNSVVYTEYTIQDIPIGQKISIVTYKKQHTGLPEDLYGYGVCYYQYRDGLQINDACCDDGKGNQWVVRPDQETGYYIYNNRIIWNDDNGFRYYRFNDSQIEYTLHEKENFNVGDVCYGRVMDVNGNYVYLKLVVSNDMTRQEVITYFSQQGVLSETDLYGVYTTGNSVAFYGNMFDMQSVTESWKPVDVFMPGFMMGYLYNGIPRDTLKSNIKAELVDNEIKLYTPSDPGYDVYENINVRRMIYTEYPDNVHPTYGVYNKVDQTSGKDYQYAEVPLLDDDLVYTDGYGDDYRHSVKGTLSVLIDNPVFTTRNNGVELASADTKYDDYLKTRTFYVSDDGYTRHQSLYYVFDLDKTEYPLLYYNTNDPQSMLNSNLKYDEDNDRYYFETMPELLLNIDNKNISKYVSKSKSVSFNISNYVREKYGQDENNIPLEVEYPKDKFFVIACCNDYYTISPVAETQQIRVILNYVGFDNTDDTKNTIYITARGSRDYTNKDSLTGGVHYVEDLYYLLYYRFTVRVSTYDVEGNDFNSDLYTQVCSVPENTAELCYIKVTDKDSEYTAYNVGDQIHIGDIYYTKNDKAWVREIANWSIDVQVANKYYKHDASPLEYWASAIKFNLSSLGTDAMTNDGKILPWLHILIEDKSGVIRVCKVQSGDRLNGGVDVVEYSTEEAMMTDYNNNN